MIIKKVVSGYVVQLLDTETRKFVNQEFIPGSTSDWYYGDTGRLLNRKKDADAELIYGKGGVDEPKMGAEMVQPPKQINHRVKIGDEVLIVPADHSNIATNEFVGKVCGFKGDLIQVKDQDDNVFDCEPEEVKPGFEA